MADAPRKPKPREVRLRPAARRRLEAVACRLRWGLHFAFALGFPALLAAVLAFWIYTGTEFRLLRARATPSQHAGRVFRSESCQMTTRRRRDKTRDTQAKTRDTQDDIRDARVKTRERYFNSRESFFDRNRAR